MDTSAAVLSHLVTARPDPSLLAAFLVCMPDAAR
jgi:hypothetical protein